jgi:hypothetical protein
MTRAPEPRLLEALAAYDAPVVELALALRDLVLEEAPEARETIVSGYAVAIGFSFTGKPIKDGFCHIVAYAGHVNLGFNRGALLPDPHHVLAGKGKMIRHVTLRSERDLGRPFLRRYLRAAIEQVGQPARAPQRRARKAREGSGLPGKRGKERGGA